MARIKGKDSKPEILIRKKLWNLGYRYRLHYKKLPGKPDIVFPSRKKVIFVNGCFWHKHDCKYFSWPQTNTEFWKKKINRNFKRDSENYKELTKLGWKYFVVWGCELKKNNFAEMMKNVINFLES